MDVIRDGWCGVSVLSESVGLQFSARLYLVDLRGDTLSDSHLSPLLLTAMSLPSTPFSFSQPSLSSGAFTEAVYRRARNYMLDFRASLESVSDAASAHEWVVGYGAATVSPFCAASPF